MSEAERIYDLYAAHALSALISKLPIIDRDGQFSSEMSQEELDKIKKDIASSAHSYAYFMMNLRESFLKSLYENNFFKP